MSRLIRTGALMLLLATSAGCGYMKGSTVITSSPSSQTETVSPTEQTTITSQNNSQQTENADQKNVNFNLTNIVENTLVNGLERPTGLSVVSENSSSRQLARDYEQRLDDKVLVTKPAFFSTDVYKIAVNLKVFRVLADNFAMPTITELTIGERDDFNTSIYKGGNIDGIDVYRPMGLLIDAALTDRGSVLISSNSSEKLFEVDADGSQRVYMENDELIGTSSIVAASDGKIYCAQTPIIFADGTVSRVLRNKRVISIDQNKNINVEFELPLSEVEHYFLFSADNKTYPGAYQLYGEQLDLVENTELGKQLNDKSKFYISDWLNSTVYKVSEDNQVAVLNDDVRYVSSITIGNLGNLFATTGPLLYTDNKTAASYPELIMLVPKTGDKQILHTFSDEAAYSTGICYLTNINGDGYCIPVSYELSTVLFENNEHFEFLFTNAQAGTIKSINATKSKSSD